MTEIEKGFFAKLHADRSENADVLEKPAMRGVQRSVVEKYSDQAHFIYELLQNADDAGAKNARFILYSDKLVFAHDGARHFSVTNPDTEEQDTKDGRLGDLNAITSIANSNKAGEKTGNKIGKFGVGFKSVFQYTVSPMIFDPGMKFRIDRFIVPTELDEDYDGRFENETLFVFPFNHPERSPRESYEDISDKLKTLKSPVLFLSSLSFVQFEIGEVKGLYGKRDENQYVINKTRIEKIAQTRIVENDIVNEKMWLFTRQDENNRAYSVGFLLDDKGKLRVSNDSAFCFFPTKEVTNLHFIIHAPFLLTDSREGIRAGVEHNKVLINHLAILAGDSLCLLRDIGEKEECRYIDDDIIDIVPTDPNVFTAVEDRQRISFLPFYTEILSRFMHEKLIPAAKGYVSATEAYWAFVPQIPRIFSDNQLQQLTGKEGVKWVFTTLGRQDTLRKNKSLSDYIDSITVTWFDEDALINGKRERSWLNLASTWKVVFNGITASFIENQSYEWLHLFYKWLGETSHRISAIINKPIFLNTENHAVSAYDSDGQLILFLPSKNSADYETVNPMLLQNKETRDFIEKVGITTPSLKDEIYNKIIPLYLDSEAEYNPDQHFLKFYEYYLECPQSEVEDYIEKLQKCCFVKYICEEEDDDAYEFPEKIYFPSSDLKTYFSVKNNTKFLDWDKYQALLDSSDVSNLYNFFVKLGVKRTVSLWRINIQQGEAQKRKLPKYNSTRGHKWTEPVIDGCRTAIREIVEKADKELSIILWKQLIQLIRDRCGRWTKFNDCMKGYYEYFYRTNKAVGYEAFDTHLLLNEKWILSSDDVFVSAKELNIHNISSKYDIVSPEANELIDFLRISREAEKDEYANLSCKQIERLKLAKRLEEAGITNESDVVEFLAWRKTKQAKESSKGNEPVHAPADEKLAANDTEGKIKEYKVQTEYGRLAKEISERAENKVPPEKKKKEHIEIDSDEYNPEIIDYDSQIEKAKEKSANELSRIVQLEELQQKVLTASKYSFGWFCSLLQMETYYGNDKASDNREVSISFARAIREDESGRTIILKDPSRSIPQFLEEIADIPLALHIEDKIRLIEIEVASVNSYTLRVKAKANIDISDIDFSKVTEAHIDAKNPSFLLESLFQKFRSLSKAGYGEEDNLQEYLPENIQFIFGPPGTGKTTYLAKNIINPLIKQENLKILVLTPTNKASDVITRKIMEYAEEKDSVAKWLVRFGITGDSEIERAGIFREKTYDINASDRIVTVTTVARFSYDYFLVQGKHVFLDEIDWDYIIFDEASMIRVADIVYPLIKMQPQKFIVAGDPFQIKPITSVPMWKEENIYTMVNLDSFTKPQTVPYQYEITNLTTQYRSIPSVGNIYSSFAYDGILVPARDENERKNLHISNELSFSSLNVIKFPISRYESIYRCKRLQERTPYQIYSALFTFEMVKYMANGLATNKEKYSIGVIAPYKAQANLIEKLLSPYKMPKDICVEVGTIHGFQGDECDIIIAVFNPPPSINESEEMFLNKKNIINVSISRARDCLIVLMPDDNTKNVEKLKYIKYIESAIVHNNESKIFESHEIEKVIFGDRLYLENNAFSTSHQTVNVYGLPERRYEIRSEESAVDIQIHDWIENEKEDIEISDGELKREGEWVSSKRYGEGQIVKRYQSEKGMKIDVKFTLDGRIVSFVEDTAFAHGALVKII